MSEGWTVVYRSIHSIACEAHLDQNFPGNLNIRYNGGERADGQYSKGYSRIVFHGDHYSAEVWE